MSQETTATNEANLDQDINQLFDDLTSAESIEERSKAIEAELQTTAMLRVQSIYAEIEELHKQYDGAIEKAPISSEISSLHRSLSEDRASVKRYGDLYDKRKQLGYGVVVLEADEAGPLVEFIESITGSHKLDMPQPPVGTRDDPELTTDYLEGLKFVGSDRTRQLAKEAGSASIVVQAKEGLSFDIPVALILSAEGFGSWAGRGERGRANKDGRSSISVIVDYANRVTPIPELPEACVMIQPDGQVWFTVEYSHRTAAAKLRGDKVISVRSLRFRKISENEI